MSSHPRSAMQLCYPVAHYRGRFGGHQNLSQLYCLVKLFLVEQKDGLVSGVGCVRSKQRPPGSSFLVSAPGVIGALLSQSVHFGSENLERNYLILVKLKIKSFH